MNLGTSSLRLNSMFFPIQMLTKESYATVKTTFLYLVFRQAMGITSLELDKSHCKHCNRPILQLSRWLQLRRWLQVSRWLQLSRWLRLSRWLQVSRSRWLPFQCPADKGQSLIILLTFPSWSPRRDKFFVLSKCNLYSMLVTAEQKSSCPHSTLFISS